MAIKEIPRGIRNNNPLNIRIGNNWRGEVANPSDKEFEQFISMQWGIRAAAIILLKYYRVYKRKNIHQIISAWAPASENNTNAYINSVSEHMGVPCFSDLNLEDEHNMFSLITAMIKVECGFEYGFFIQKSSIEKGIKMALLDVEYLIC